MRDSEVTHMTAGRSSFSKNSGIIIPYTQEESPVMEEIREITEEEQSMTQTQKIEIEILLN